MSALMRWPQENWTETRLREEGFSLEFTRHCEQCDETINVYSKWDIGKKRYIGIIDGTQETHQCRPS